MTGGECLLLAGSLVPIQSLSRYTQTGKVLQSNRRSGGKAWLRPDDRAALLRVSYGGLFRVLAMGHKVASPLLFFNFNCFRLDSHGNFPWSGFRNNRRVLK